MLSRTYRQSSFDRPDCRKVNPENRLLWHHARRRLDLEAMRDTRSTSPGDWTAGWAGDRGRRRQFRRPAPDGYGLVDRQSLPRCSGAFDFASPDQSAERRPRTTVRAQQALYSMNAPFVIDRRRRRSLARTRPEPRSKTGSRAYRDRPGRPRRRRGRGRRTFIQADRRESARGLSRSERLAQVLLMTNELLFVSIGEVRMTSDLGRKTTRRRPWPSGHGLGMLGLLGSLGDAGDLIAPAACRPAAAGRGEQPAVPGPPGTSPPGPSTSSASI